MLTSVDKAWVAGVVSFVSQYVLAQFFHINIDPTVQAAIVSVLAGVMTWWVPNKTTK